MKIEILKGPDRQHGCGFLFDEEPIINDPVNIRYSHTKGNCMFFQIVRFPYKRMLEEITRNEDGIIESKKAYVRVCIKMQETVACLVLRYTVKIPDCKASDELERWTVVTKERVFNMVYTKEEIVRLADPMLKEIRNANPPQSAEAFLKSYNEWAHPMTWQKLTRKLNKQQKEKAVKLLQAMFL